ncbi:MAG: hypothetical protein K0R12_462 [Gammaproteobacteria bacterium]|jgi:ubiquinone biosynthesis monooxygenase Coq7|nr:hypothetical protein [Gammaproteobacteria bacterium]
MNTIIDKLILQVDYGLRTICLTPSSSTRPSPANAVSSQESLNLNESRLSANLLRVDDAGEVSAQALYQGQALTTRSADLKATLLEAAEEENDHLAWCQERLYDLGAHRSYFNPLWYMGSFCLGVIAGLIGDRWSLGFLAETEKQVVKHLEDHLARLSNADQKTRRVFEQMREDELKHATTAIQYGAADLPAPIQRLMKGMSKVMTTMSFYL